jgi:hypothetical protein
MGCGATIVQKCPILWMSPDVYYPFSINMISMSKIERKVDIKSRKRRRS